MKLGTLAGKRKAILQKEAHTFDKLTAALDATGEMAARVISVQTTGENTNTRVQQLQASNDRMEKQLREQGELLKALKSSQDEQHAVTVEGRMPASRAGQSSSERKLQLQANVRRNHTMIKQINMHSNTH